MLPNTRPARVLSVLALTLSAFFYLGTASAESNTATHTTVIVQFPLPAGVDSEQAKAMFEASAPNYKNLPGLIRKYYLFGDGPVGGGVYLWESREAAAKVYTAAWRQGLAERVGAEPTVTYFETPVIVDNTQ